VSAPPAARARLTALEGVGLAGALALAALAMAPLRGYLTDDTFIHLQIARHLAQGLGPVFNPGERVYGFTSPLWVGLLALGMKLGLEGLVVARALGGAATLAAVVCFFAIARRTLASPALRVAATLAWAGHAWMARWSLSGMETPLAVALVLAGFAALVAGERGGGHRARVGLAWALAALARPEAMLLVALWAAALIADPAVRARPRHLVAGLAWPVILVGGWLLFARGYFGSFLPATLSAKAAGSGGWAGLADNLRRAVPAVLATDAVFVLAWLALARRGRGTPTDRPDGRIAAAWILLVPAIELARGVPLLTRYLLVVLPVLEWRAWVAIERAGLAGAEGARRMPSIAALVAGLVLGNNVISYTGLVLPQVTSFTRAMHASLIPFGRWIAAHAPADATVATPDIGAIGWFGERRVLDLGGLVTPRMIPLLEREPFEDALARLDFADFARPTFVLDRAARANDLLARSPYAAAFAPVDSAAVPNLGIARPGRVVYTLYRLDWSRVPRGRVGP